MNLIINSTAHRTGRSRVPRSQRRISLLLPALATATVLGLAGCSGDDTSAESEDGRTAVSLLAPFPPGPSYSQVFVAPELGYFEDENLDVTVDVAEGSSKVIQQVLARNADFGIASASATINAFQDSPSLRVYACHTVGQIFRVAAPEGSGVNSIADLAGRTLGVSDLAGGEIPIIEAMLQDAGLESGTDVNLLPVGDASAALVDAIESGTIDAYSSGFEIISALRAAGLDMVDITPSEFGAVPSSCMITREEVIADEDGAAIAVGIGRAWAKAGAFAAANTEAALDIVCDAQPESCANQELAESIITDTVAITTSEDPDFPYAKVVSESWELAAEILADSGVTEDLVDISDLIGSSEVTAIQEQVNDWSRDEVTADAANY